MPTEEQDSQRPPAKFCDQCGAALGADPGTGGDPEPAPQGFIPIGDDDETPAETIPPPLSGTALNLLDVALATQSVVENLRETARQLDRVEGVARRHLCVEASRRLTSLGGVFAEAGLALKEEGERE
jgi:hypothetical protein